MPVKQLDIAEFGAFERASFDFADGLNVFVGPNGTGKTHVMKLLYAMLETARAGTITPALFKGALAAKLAGVFRPDAGEIGRLVRRKQGLNTASVLMTTGPIGSPSTPRSEPRGKPAVSFKLHTKGALKPHFLPGAIRSRSIFLPTREVLAMYEGFVHAYTERELSFDQTYFDLCVALSGNPLRGKRKQTAERLANKLQAALGGHTELKGDRFYVKFEGDRARMEAHLVAEGLRKVASLERLVLNGSLTRNAHLFWDEPEANLNPKLIVVVVDVLAELARSGVQLFLTTHDYLLARRISLAAKRKEFPATRFFAFFRPNPGSPVSVASGDQLSDLPPNPMVDEFLRLYDFEMESLAKA